jgi:hypothetical protein
MLRPDEIDQTTDALEALPSVIEPFSRTVNRRSASIGRQQDSQHHIFQEKQTDTLPALEFEPPKGRGVLRQIAVLREENRHQRSLLERQRVEIQQLVAERNRLKEETEKALEISQYGLQQEIGHFQERFQEAVAERDRLQESCERLEKRYQEVQSTFEQAIEREAQRQVTEAAQALIESPEHAPVLFQDIAKTIELRLRQEEEKHLIETLYLKREIQRMAEWLEQERKQLQAEQQQVVVLQYSAREQAEQRQKLLHERLHARWKTASVMTSLGLLVLLVVLQFVFLSVFHIRVTSMISLALVAPIVACVVLAFILAGPLGMLRQMYQSAPHRKKK